MDFVMPVFDDNYTIMFEVKEMELAEIRHELENTAKKLADFRGSL